MAPGDVISPAFLPSGASPTISNIPNLFWQPDWYTEISPPIKQAVAGNNQIVLLYSGGVYESGPTAAGGFDLPPTIIDDSAHVYRLAMAQMSGTTDGGATYLHYSARPYHSPTLTLTIPTPGTQIRIWAAALYIR
jgi:hypothetical protein